MITLKSKFFENTTGSISYRKPTIVLHVVYRKIKKHSLKNYGVMIIYDNKNKIKDTNAGN
jgi:hypothetical protein